MSEYIEKQTALFHEVERLRAEIERQDAKIKTLQTLLKGVLNSVEWSSPLQIMKLRIERELADVINP